MAACLPFRCRARLYRCPVRTVRYLSPVARGFHTPAVALFIELCAAPSLIVDSVSSPVHTNAFDAAAFVRYSLLTGPSSSPGRSFYRVSGVHGAQGAVGSTGSLTLTNATSSQAVVGVRHQRESNQSDAH